MYFRKQSLERSWRAPKTSVTLNASGNVSVPFGRALVTIEGRGAIGNPSNPGNPGNVSGSYYLAGNVSGYNSEPAMGEVAVPGTVSGYNPATVSGYNPPTPGNPSGRFGGHACSKYYTGATPSSKGTQNGYNCQTFSDQNACSVTYADNLGPTNWPVYAPNPAPPGVYIEAMIIPFTIIAPGTGFEAFMFSCGESQNPPSGGNPNFNPPGENYNPTTYFYGFLGYYNSNPNFNPNYYQLNYNPPNNPIPGNAGNNSNLFGADFPGGPGQDGGVYGSPAPPIQPAPYVPPQRISGANPHGLANTATTLSVTVPSGGYVTLNFE